MVVEVGIEPQRQRIEVGAVMIRQPKVLDVATPAGDARRLLADDHVHLVLVVDRNGMLVTAIEHADLDPLGDDHVPARTLGRLRDRVVSPQTPVRDALAQMQRSNRRRLAVVDDAGLLVGLLCLKRSGRGFCSDDDVRSRRRLLSSGCGAAPPQVLPGAGGGASLRTRG